MPQVVHEGGYREDVMKALRRRRGEVFNALCFPVDSCVLSLHLCRLQQTSSGDGFRHGRRSHPFNVM